MRIRLSVFASIILVACGPPQPAPEVQSTQELLLGPEAALSESQETVPTNLLEAAQEIVDALAAQDYASVTAQFDAQMAEALPLEELQAIWEALIVQVGPYQRQLGIRSDVEQGYNRVFVTVEFESTTLDTIIVFGDEDLISGLFFAPTEDDGSSDGSDDTTSPPPYVDLDSFEERAVEVVSGDFVLPGTLSVPIGDGPFAAIILVHGSGPQDRDETVGPNKPFRDLAWGLATQGIAVLRYEKRTREYGAQMAEILNQLTVREETIDDALAAVNLLREIPDIDASRIFVLGHSLGGMLIPWIGSEADDIAGFVIMAGSTRRLEDIILDQLDFLHNLDGVLSDEETLQLELIEAEVQLVKDLDPAATDQTQSMLVGAPLSYWLSLQDYDPAEAAQDLQEPILVMQGLRDYQVTIEDLNGWQSTISIRDNVEFKTYPKLNHLFIEGEGQPNPIEYQIQGYVAEYVILDIANWLKQL